MRIAHRTAARMGVATVAAGVLAAGAFTLVSSAGASPSGSLWDREHARRPRQLRFPDP